LLICLRALDWADGWVQASLNVQEHGLRDLVHHEHVVLFTYFDGHGLVDQSGVLT